MQIGPYNYRVLLQIHTNESYIHIIELEKPPYYE